MKILMVSPVYPPSIGGIEQHVKFLSEQLRKDGHKARVLTTKIEAKKPKKEENVSRLEVGIKNYPELATKGRKMVPKMAMEILSMQRKEKFDLIHSHCPFTLLASIPAKVLFGAKLAVTIHGNWVNCIKGRRYFNGKICNTYAPEKCAKCLGKSRTEVKAKQFALENSLKFADGIISVSRDVKKSLKTGSKARQVVLPNVSGYTKVKNSRTAARKKLKTASNKKIALFVGGMFEEKGPHILLKAFAEASKKISNTELWLLYANSGKEFEKAFRKEVQGLGLRKKVFFFEKIPHKKVMEEFLPAADAAVLPSLWPEPCSSIATEAMVAGTALIASRTGGFPDLVKDGETGLLFPAGDSSLLGKLLVKVLSKPALRKRLEANAAKAVREELNWRTVGKKTEDFYGELIP